MERPPASSSARSSRKRERRSAAGSSVPGRGALYGTRRHSRRQPGVDAQHPIDEALRVEALHEIAGRASLLDWMGGLRPELRRQSEDLDERQLGTNAARRLDAVHVRHRNIHQDDIGLERARLIDRLEPVAGVSDDLELALLLQ